MKKNKKSLEIPMNFSSSIDKELAKTAEKFILNFLKVNTENPLYANVFFSKSKQTFYIMKYETLEDAVYQANMNDLGEIYITTISIDDDIKKK